MQTLDLIIAGAGPAGLSLAANLAERCSVLVLERGELGRSQATWCSYGDRVRHHGLDDAVAFRSGHMVFRSRRYVHRMLDDFVVLDQNRALGIWLERARARGARFVQDALLYHESDRDAVTVHGASGRYRARLLIDCSGPMSPIVRSHRLLRRKDSWVLFGALTRLSEPGRPLEISYRPLNDAANTYLGVHPVGPRDANIYIFQGQHGTFGDPPGLEPLFREALGRHHPSARILAPLAGRITSGALRRSALPRVLFFGASGMMTPDAIGMGFNEILRRVDRFSDGVAQALAEDRLGQSELERIAHGMQERESMRFQRIVGAFSLHFARAESQWDAGVRWLNALGTESRAWMRNELSAAWVRRATLLLHRAAPIGETLRLIPATELLLVASHLAQLALGGWRSRSSTGFGAPRTRRTARDQMSSPAA